MRMGRCASGDHAADCAQHGRSNKQSRWAAACQQHAGRSWDGGMQPQVLEPSGIHLLFSKRSQDLPPSPVTPAHTHTHLLGTWAAEASTAPEVAARLPDRLLPLPGRECLLLLPCQDGVTACCHCRCCRAVGRGVHALYVAASCCLLAWGAPAAVRALHSTPHHHMHSLCKGTAQGQAGPHPSCMPIADSSCFVTHLLGGWRAPVQHSAAGPAQPWPLWVGICGVTEDPAAAADVPPTLLGQPEVAAVLGGGRGELGPVLLLVLSGNPVVRRRRQPTA